jgi:hypothetical protein
VARRIAVAIGRQRVVLTLPPGLAPTVRVIAIRI